MKTPTPSSPMGRIRVPDGKTARWALLGLAALLCLAALAATVDQARRVQDNLSARVQILYDSALRHTLFSLFHDVDILGVLLASTESSQAPLVAAYLNDRRETFSLLPYLAELPATPGGLPTPLIATPPLADFDPGTRPEIAALRQSTALGGWIHAFSLPGRTEQSGFLLLAIPEPALGGTTGMPPRLLVAMLDSRRLLDRAFANLPPGPLRVELRLGHAVVARWPDTGRTDETARRAEDMTTVDLANTGLSVAYLRPHRSIGSLLLSTLAPGRLTVGITLIWCLAIGGVAMVAVVVLLTPRGHRKAPLPLATAERAPAPPKRSGGGVIPSADGLGFARLSGPSRTIAWADPAFDSLLGVSTAGGGGRTLADTIPGPDSALPADGILRLERPDQPPRWIRLALFPIPEGGDLAVAEDVSRQREAELRAFATGRLWMLGDLARSLAHDLNQPFNVMRLTAESALDRLNRGEIDPARATRAFAAVATQCQRARELLDTVLIATRRPETPPQPFSTVAALRDALHEILSRLKQDGIALVWQPDPATPPVPGHRDRFIQAMGALFANACDAIAAAPQTIPSASPPRLRVSCAPTPDGHIHIAIEDSGTGLPDPILRALETPTPMIAPLGRAGGIGLPIALGVIAEMNGRLLATNTGTGARIDILLPIGRRPGQDGARRLLLIDDDRDHARAIAETLAPRGWRVDTAADPEDAWHRFEVEPADVVIADPTLGDGGGFALIARLRDQAPHVPVIAIADMLGETARRAVEAGAALVLDKPVAPADLAEELDDMVPPPP